MAPPPAPEAALRRARRLNAVLLGLLGGTALVAAAFFSGRVPGLSGGASSQALLDVPAVRERVVAELLDRNPGIFDSHPDPDVGRVLAPGLADVEFMNVRVTTNRWGLREREFELPKPEGVVRIVFLGDSFVFGLGVEAEERMGVFLERALAERARGAPGPLEVLHVGIGSWNAVAETEFLRRQLAEYAPDLVVQLLIDNDLDDNAGARGFGTRAGSVPRFPRQTSALVTSTYPVPRVGPGNTNYLLDGFGEESVRRYRDLALHVGRLAAAVEARGGRYLAAADWGRQARVLAAHLEGHLREDQRFWIAEDLMGPEHRVGPRDHHWNRDGHERFARLVYGLARARNLLPGLDLAPWPAADELARTATEAGLASARGRLRPLPRLERALSSLAFERPTPEVFRQVYTGIEVGGLTAPYASMLLAREGGRKLRVRGRRLGRPELEGGRTEVWVEDVRLGELSLTGEPRFELELDLDLPEEARFVNVRFVSDDWIYAGAERREMASLVLESVAVVGP